MLTDRTLRRQLVTFSLLVATCLLLLAFSETRPIQDLRGGVNFALAPIRETLSGGARAMGSLFTAVAELDQLRTENAGLQERLQQLEEANLQIPVLITQNGKLTEALKVKRSLDHRTLAAEVIYSDPSSIERLITIGKGTDAGVFLGAAVLSPGGSLVGAVTEVGSNWATVRLINDTRSVVIGRDVRTRATGEVHGNLSAPLELNKVQFTEDSARRRPGRHRGHPHRTRCALAVPARPGHRQHRQRGPGSGEHHHHGARPASRRPRWPRARARGHGLSP